MEVLVVVDMQNDFINGSLGTKEAEAIVNNVINRVEYAKMMGELVICTQDTHDEHYLETQEGYYLPIFHCQLGHKGWELPEKLADAINKCSNIRIKKETFGSFGIVKNLKTFEQEMDFKIEGITIVGLCTDICVVTNALILKTAFPNIPIHVEANCCAGTTPEKHKAALEVMKSCQIHVWEEDKEKNNEE